MPLIAKLLMRFVQALGLIAILIGCQQFPALYSFVSESAKNQTWPLGTLGFRILAVTAPCLIGGMMIVLLQLLLNHYVTFDKRLRQYANEPWLVHPMWARKHLLIDSRPIHWFFIIAAILYLFVLVPLAIGTEMTPFYVIIGILGAFLLMLGRVFWLGRKWRRAELKLITLPGVIGGPFNGVITLHETFPPETSFDVSLRCEQTEVVKRGKSSESKVKVLWSSMLQIGKTLQDAAPHTTAFPISFAIPYECKPTELTGSKPITWRVIVNRKEDVSTGGASFDVPIFRTAQSRTDFQLDTAKMEAFQVKHDPLQILRRYNFVRTSLANGQERWEWTQYDPQIFFTFIVLGIILVCIQAAIFYFVAPQSLFLASLIPGVCLAGIGYGIIQMAFWKCTIESVDRERHLAHSPNDDEHFVTPAPRLEKVPSIQVVSGLKFFRKSVLVPRDPSTTFVCQLHHRTEDKEVWKLFLKAPSGETILLMHMLQGPAEARAMQEWFQQEVYKKHA